MHAVYIAVSYYFSSVSNFDLHSQKNAVYNFKLLERGKNLLYVGDYNSLQPYTFGRGYGYKWLSIIKINNRSLPSFGFGRTTTPATPLPSLTPSHPSAAPKSLQIATVRLQNWYRDLSNIAILFHGIYRG
jgi:hypothetical protein